MDTDRAHGRIPPEGTAEPALPEPGAPGLREAIAALAARASIETSTRDLAEVAGYATLLRPGTDVYVTWIPGRTAEHIVAVCAGLQRVGMNPVPHLAAREIAGVAALDRLLARLRAEAGVARALVIAGDVAKPAGPFASSLALLETGLLQVHGIRHIALAAYPEGHPMLSARELWDAIAAKLAYAGAQGLEATLVTQFGFDGGAIVAWLRELRARGVTQPVRVGLAGPASVRALLKFAAHCGIGNSARVLTTRAGSVGRLIARRGPEAVVAGIAPAAEPLGVAGLHLFAFGGFAASARWLRAVAERRFTLGPAETGFTVSE